MQKAYSAVTNTVAKFVRWIIAGVISVIVSIPTFASLSTSI